MPSDAERIAAKVENHRTKIGELGRELLAIRKAATGEGPVTPGVQDEIPPQDDSPDPAKPKIKDEAAADAEDDIGEGTDAPEVLDGKSLTPAQKAARDLADAMGLLPGNKAKIPINALVNRAGRAISDASADHASRVRSGSVSKFGINNEVERQFGAQDILKKHIAKDKRQAATQAGLIGTLLGLGSGGAAGFAAGKKSIDFSGMEEGEKTKLLKILQGLGSTAAIAGGGATVLDAHRRKSERNKHSRSKIAQIQAVLEGRKELEDDEKGVKDQYMKFAKWVEENPTKYAGLSSLAIGAALLGTKKGRGLVGLAGTQTAPKTTARVRGMGNDSFEIGRSIRKNLGFDPGMKEWAVERLAQLHYGQKNMLEDPDYNGVPGVQDPGEVERIKAQLDLTPQEEALFDEMAAEGSNVEQVDAGESAAPSPEEMQQPQAPAQPQEAPMDVSMYHQAPAQNKPGAPAVEGQLPTDTNVQPDMPDAPAQARPEGSGSLQGTPEGQETSVAAPMTSSAMAHAIPGASQHVVDTPPVGSAEALQTGQTEEDAFESLVQKLERYEEQMQPGGKSLSYDEKGVARILAKLARKAVRGTRRGGGAVSRFGNSVAAGGGPVASRVGDAIGGAGRFAAANPRKTIGAGVVAAGLAGDGRRNDEPRRQF